MKLAAEFLSSKNLARVKIIISKDQGQLLKVLVKGVYSHYTI
ncbi:hypothetical protein J536_1456 [Acinetobacter sp. 809848]|jgi:hypothetical protein|nr:hypothetical protein J536_1456 [Acinetobacter sp. 809848]